MKVYVVVVVVSNIGDHVPETPLFETSGKVIVVPKQIGAITENVGDEVVGIAFITTLAETKEVQFEAFVTVKFEVPVANPEIVTVGVVPKIAPGFIVQLPNGNPLKVTLPVGIVQEG